MRKDTSVEQEHPGIRPTVQETYGPLNFGHRPMFGGGFINFGYWQGIDLAGPLGEDERALSQQALYRHVLDAAGPLRRRQVLDVGCGLGTGCAVALTEYEPDGVTGMDIHPNQLARAREEQAVLLGEQPGRLRFAEGAAKRMPWQDGAFDVVVSVEAMQHFPDLAGFAAETARVLRPGGTVAVTSFFTADETPGCPEQLARLLDTYASGLDIARPVTALAEAFAATGLAEVRAVSIGPEVWPGWDCWLSRWWAPGTWPRNFLRAYEDKILDYFVVMALKPLWPTPRPPPSRLPPPYSCPERARQRHVPVLRKPGTTSLATPLRALRRTMAFGAAAGLAPTAARADVVTPSAAPSVRMLTCNACGDLCAHEGVTAAQWAAAIKTSVDNWSADTPLLTEVCYGQYAALRDSLTGCQPVWLATSSGPASCGKWTSEGDKRFGMAVFVKSTAPVEHLTADLPESPADSNKRALLCAKGGIEGRTALACMTHLTHRGDKDEDDEDLLDTARVQQAQVDAWALPVILGGDFNAHPTDPERGEFYGFQGGTGRYGEVDETDEDRPVRA